MTPKELMAKHGIRRTQMPEIFQKSYRQMDRYLAGDFPDDVRSQCFLLDYFLSNGGTLLQLLAYAYRNFDLTE
ncbi:MAG: hypothetical protein HC815_28415 [Richelia sp. RM1_1_1]|nr:hypothetical protein [Richelia sp. RM1_1_1]